ncbi:MAG: protein kinase, partial [Holophagaceae bacterium]|nr:protein kinase [Holophagaceae bacterium]
MTLDGQEKTCNFDMASVGDESNFQPPLRLTGQNEREGVRTYVEPDPKDNRDGKVYIYLDQSTREQVAVRFISRPAPTHDDPYVSRNTAIMDIYRQNRELLNENKNHELLNVPVIDIDDTTLSSQNKWAIVLQYNWNLTLQALIDERCGKNKQGFASKTNKPGFTPKAIKEIALGILDRVNELHEGGILHLNLRPVNIGIRAPLWEASIKREHISIIDVEYIHKTDKIYVHRNTGNPKYNSPEQLTSDEEVGTSSDMYSFGVILHRLLYNGRRPFKPFSAQESKASQDAYLMYYAQQHREGVPAFEGASEKYPPPQELVGLCRKALSKVPNSRIGLVEAMEILESFSPLTRMRQTIFFIKERLLLISLTVSVAFLVIPAVFRLWIHFGVVSVLLVILW